MTSPLEFNATPGRPEPVPPPTPESQGTPGKPGEFEAGMQSGWSSIDMRHVLDAANTISPPAARAATPPAVEPTPGGAGVPGATAGEVGTPATPIVGGSSHERLTNLHADLQAGRIDQQTFMMRLVSLQMD